MKIVRELAVVLVVFAAVVGVLYVRNTPPDVPAIAAADDGRPYVIKLHARWCPICMVTTGVWSKIEDAYAGRVNFVVFDFTNAATTDASRDAAAQMGLQTFFEANAGWTGTVSVVDGRTKEELASVHGVKGFDEYRAAIDAALRAAK